MEPIKKRAPAMMSAKLPVRTTEFGREEPERNSIRMQIPRKTRANRPITGTIDCPTASIGYLPK
jgi:hypothetical protein